MPPKFLYFDLGNVLLFFDHRQMCRQLADVAGVDWEQVWHVLFDTGLELRYESGELDEGEFYEAFCEALDKRPDFDALEHAGAAIFEVNVPLTAVVAQLRAARYRLGLLSNTSPSHYKYFADGRYGLIPSTFDVLALSYEIGALKPDPKIYLAAAELAGVRPEEIFFVDDVAGHVEGARAVGFDAVQYTTTPALVAELRARGLQFNY